MGISLPRQCNPCMTAEPYALPKVLPLHSDIFILEDSNIIYSQRSLTKIYQRFYFSTFAVLLNQNSFRLSQTLTPRIDFTRMDKLSPPNTICMYIPYSSKFLAQ